MPILLHPSKVPIFLTKPKLNILSLTFHSKPISTSPVPSHQHIAHLILDQKSPSQAIQTFKWASKLPHFTHTQSTYRALVHKLCVFRCFDIAREVLDQMPSSIGENPDEDVFVTLVRGFGRARMIRDVIRVVDLVCKFGKSPSLKILNSILDVLVKEDIDIARQFYRKKMVGSDVVGDDYTFGIMMKGLCLTNRIGDGFKLLQMIKNRGVIPNAVIYNTLIHALCRNGKVGRARSLMSEMREPSEVTFNILISAYCGEDNLVQALVMLEKCFKLGLVPDVITLTKVVEILCNKGRALEAVEVVETVERKGGIVDVVAYNTLIKGFSDSGKVKVGHRFLKEMERKGCLPNADTYNILISGFCESGMLDSASDMFNEMKLLGIHWNFITYDTLIRGFCSRGRMKDGLQILELTEESKGGSGGHISPYNSVIYGLYKENCADEALEFLNNMARLFPRAVDKSLKIIGLCKDGDVEDAHGLYEQMKKEGGVPSAVVHVHLIHGFCKIGRAREAFSLINEMVGHGYLPIASTFNVLILELCKQGRTESASKFLEDMIERGCLPDSGSYGPVVDGFCRKGDLQKALMLFLQMVERSITPDLFIWNALVVCISQKNAWVGNRNLLASFS
ncbi:Pentatricopeptide repeat-containing protein, mitochondrial [Heracleum sosnowskyi]|uniref:Pentatricopeptide repeat-containing protein, mitochondrial n=1 Tax=Heracleum sosnowskyi TaxID=360622 RepID=A0AAD8H5N2_9APIA|nr:Pentatricopeptide repeat-containing protein, mitochondrial [Heracleum sosnowskyi]